MEPIKSGEVLVERRKKIRWNIEEMGSFINQY